MTSLFVRLDPITLLRQPGGLDPEPAVAASLAELAGADGVSATGGREAGRVQERDLRLLREVVRGVLNVCLPPADEQVKLALALRPDMVTFVPEAREGQEPARGLDIEDRRGELAPWVQALHGGGVHVAALVDPAPPQVKAAQRLGIGTVLLHTGRLVWAGSAAARASEYEALLNAAKVAHRLGLVVHAGGGLGYQSVRPVAEVEEVAAVHVGHALAARALLVGMAEAVRELLRLLGGVRP
jgi:pyridoxine 5-phosphate synthase